MEKKRSVGIIVVLLFICFFIIPNPNLYCQEAPPFEVVLWSNLKIRSELEDKIKNILEDQGFNVVSATITVEEEETSLRAIANVNIALLENEVERITQYLSDIKEAISKEMPGFVNYRISFTFETLTSPAPSYKEPKGVTSLAKEERWGEQKNGFRTQLIPMSDEYTIGQPMEFSLVMKNVSDSFKWYNSQRIGFSDLIIKDATGKEVLYNKGMPMTVGPQRPIDTGEIVILFENREITADYDIPKPGKYSIQFRGGPSCDLGDKPFPLSNIIEFEAKVAP